MPTGTAIATSSFTPTTRASWTSRAFAFITEEAGDANAPALVLIHGFASSTLVWSKVFLRLAAAGFRVIAIDMLGFGYSGKPRNGEYTIAGQATLEIGRAHV